MEETLTLQFDGGSRGNPGPAGIGVVVSAADGTPLVTLGRFIGRATNNVAEYRALITAMEEAQKLGAKKVLIRGDSELIIKQMKGIYKVRNPDMQTLHAQAQGIIRKFEQAKIEHNLREKNELADKLANLAMDRRADVTELSGKGSANVAIKTMAISKSPTQASPVKSAPVKSAPVESALDEPSPEASVAGDLHGCLRCGCSIQVRNPTGIRPHQQKPFVCQCGSKMQRS